MRPNRRQARAISPTPSEDSKIDELDDFDELSDNDLNAQDLEGSGDLGNSDEDDADIDQLEDSQQSESDLEDDGKDEDEDEEEEEDDKDEDNDESDVTTPKKTRATKRKNNDDFDDDDDDDLDEDTEVVSNRALTKRQRAKLNNDTLEEFLELPMESNKKKHLTQEEQALRRSEVARRRKNQSIQRAEKDKEDTINRLLKKQASKSRRVIKEDPADDKDSPSNRRLAMLRDPNSLHYVNNKEGGFLSIPTSVAIEQVFLTVRNTPKEPQVCQVANCSNFKKYTAKKSGKAVCSLEHYKLVDA